MTKATPKNRRGRDPHRTAPRYAYKMGDLVYFHAYADPSDHTSYFLCQGYVARQPTNDSRVYKVIVVAVDPKSVLCGEKPDIARRLLGMKIAREPIQLSSEPSGLMKLFYKNTNWLHITEKELKKIKTSIRRRK